MIINFSNIGSGSGGGSGYTLPIATETRLGGVKVGSGLTIDPSTGVLSASGGTGGQKVIDLNALTQQERAALHTELNANSGSANEDYVFYYSSNNTYISEYSNKPLRYQVVQFGQEIKFFLTVGRQDAAYFVVLNVNLKQDGTITSGYHSFYTAQKAGVNQLGMVKVGSGLTIDGSGVLSVSGGTGSQVSVTQELSAGTKIATVTVDGVGTDLFAPAGGTGGEQNYLIVDALSDITDPVDGMYVYVNSGTSHIGPYSAFSFDASDCTGGQFYWQDSDPFYITGDNPPMVDVGGWAIPEEDGEWHYFSGPRGNLWIKYDPQTDIYSIALPYDNITNLVINLNDNLPYTGSTETINKNYKGYFSRRINGNWIRTEYHLEEMIGDELVQAYSELVSLSGQSFTDIYWKNRDGGITKATYWAVDWNDNQKIRVTGSVDKKTFTMSFTNNGVIEEQSSFEPKEQVYYVNFDYSQSTSAWTSDIYDVAYNIYSSWDNPKLIYARVYDTDNSKKLGMGNVMHFWHNTNDEMYYNFCFGFNFVDLNGVEWKTKWTFSQQDEPNYTLVSMTQVS